MIVLCTERFDMYNFPRAFKRTKIKYANQWKNDIACRLHALSEV